MNQVQDGFEAKTIVVKTDTGWTYRIVLIGTSADFDETSTRIYRTALQAFRAGHEKLYTEVLGVLTGG